MMQPDPQRSLLDHPAMSGSYLFPQPRLVDDPFTVNVDGAEISDEAYWERGWKCLFDALHSLAVDDLSKTIDIRGEPDSVPLAIQRSLGHTCYHVGQIVQVARIHPGNNWETLTIPRGGSEQFNKENWGQSGRSVPGSNKSS